MRFSCQESQSSEPDYRHYIMCPVVISSVAICQIFTKLFSVTPTGVINALLSVFNPDLLYMEWISNDSLSLIIAASVEGYKYLGLYMVIFYAALIGIPKELDEAAIMDGANVIQQYRYVKIPYIRPVIIANCILVLKWLFAFFRYFISVDKGWTWKFIRINVNIHV